MSPHLHQNVAINKKKKRLVLMRTWKNWIPYALLVGMKNGIATMEEYRVFSKN